MKNKHLVVVSVDAMVCEDLEYAKTLPNFSKLMTGASIINKVKTIYPSLTHPVHATMITGATAGKTGVINNVYFNPGKEEVWFNKLSDIKCKTIFEVAKEAGLTTSACRWPLTYEGNNYIDYLVPEVFGAYMSDYEKAPLEAYVAAGTQEVLWDTVKDAIKEYGYENTHPEYDAFQIKCAAEIIRRYQPNMIFIHPGNVDYCRHNFGVFSDAVKSALRDVDEWLGELISAVEDAGIADTTDFVIVSDHGQLPITRVVCPNVFLADRGLISLDEGGNVTSWDAYIASGALMGEVYLARPDDKQLYDKVYGLLSDMAEEGIYGFTRVFTVDEVREKYGLYGDFSFVIETDGFTSFGESAVRPAVRLLDTADYRFGKGTHGHLPERGPQPIFIAKGPSIKENVTLAEGSILNHAPTFAKIFGLTLPDADGVPVSEILK